ncbi:3-isopropylmalate dehydratase small subunit [Biformimicrobium ophioploci]|uniref:3-isopropylmalate dehydratase small subunit n=1 Tax=Biformimicrobium ophioploci TaxID=3036711 RepID=A0ABQ6LW35_9GAMM|nr:3-isopropylmalate dehydratase small subunit [Microbulbifer sp. NKW57]GMG86288.1 3-isopropylmalate dehydratase small subunit [Microbulbifer sp. NKW57]
MKAFTRHSGVAAPLRRRNIDTDAIIPSREMKRVSRHGLGEGLFAGWRYTLPGGREPNPEFVLNRPEYSAASILLGGDNFGCGSSREHAVWALAEFGIRAIIASGYGAIFYTNCVRNGVLPVCLPDADVEALAQLVESDPQANPVAIDLERGEVRCGTFCKPFEMDSASRHMLLHGLDPISLTLQSDAEIVRFEGARRARFGWAFSPLKSNASEGSQDVEKMKSTES